MKTVSGILAAVMFASAMTAHAGEKPGSAKGWIPVKAVAHMVTPQV